MSSAVRTALQPRRRGQPRFPMRSLAYVRLEQSNGGIVRDLTESGIAVQTVTPLHAGDEVDLRFELLAPRIKVETRGEVVWTDSNGQAGVRFVDIPSKVRRVLRDWILLQMLTAAAVSGRDTMFLPLDSQFVVSDDARPAISLTPGPAMVTWGILSLSVQGFGVFVDSVVLLCAVLLFSIGGIAAMGSVPPLPMAGALICAAGAIFVAAYQLIFSDFLLGASPGKRLAAAASGRQLEDRILTRFR